MTNYNPIIDFSVKDTLPTGDPDKLIVGGQWDSELGSISEAIASKAEGTGTALEASDTSWTPTWGAGFSTDPTGDLRYRVFTDGTNDFATVSPAERTDGILVGTADANTMSISAIPTAIRPDGTVLSNVFQMTGAADSFPDPEIAICIASITAAGVITFLAYDDGADVMGAANWATSGDKGFDFNYANFTYPLTVTA